MVPIVIGKVAPAVLCGWGMIRMVQARNESSDEWHESKSLAIGGCALAVANLFFGWVVVGEFVFMMFMDPGLSQAASASFRYGGLIALIMIFVARRE